MNPPNTPSLHPRLGAGAPSQQAGTSAEASTRPVALSSAAGSFSSTPHDDLAPPFTKAEAAKFLRISIRSLERGVADRVIPCAKIGSRIVFPRRTLAAWIEAQAAASLEVTTTAA